MGFFSKDDLGLLDCLVTFCCHKVGLLFVQFSTCFLDVIMACWCIIKKLVEMSQKIIAKNFVNHLTPSGEND